MPCDGLMDALLTVKIFLRIPDDWKIVEHPNGAKAIEFCPDRYMKFSLVPLITDDARPDIFEPNEAFTKLMQKYIMFETVKVKRTDKKEKSKKQKKAQE